MQKVFQSIARTRGRLKGKITCFKVILKKLESGNSGSSEFSSIS